MQSNVFIDSSNQYVPCSWLSNNRRDMVLYYLRQSFKIDHVSVK